MIASPEACRPASFWLIIWAESEMITQTLTLAVTLFLFASSVRGAIIAGPVTNNATGHIYYLLSQNSWPSSEAEARALGGHLVTIDDQLENDWVFSTFAAFAGQPRCLWIGYHRQQTHGNFSWVGGMASTFTNWSVGEPNDHFYGGEPEYFAFMWDPSRTEFFRAPGTWNDVPDITAMDAIPICGVVEITPLRLMTRPHVDGIQIGWESRASKAYQVEYRVSLAATNSWSSLGSPVAGNGSTNFVIDTILAPERYYRVGELP